jgi:hypothetical protein
MFRKFEWTRKDGVVCRRSRRMDPSQQYGGWMIVKSLRSKWKTLLREQAYNVIPPTWPIEFKVSKGGGNPLSPKCHYVSWKYTPEVISCATHPARNFWHSLMSWAVRKTKDAP